MDFCTGPFGNLSHTYVQRLVSWFDQPKSAKPLNKYLIVRTFNVSGNGSSNKMDWFGTIWLVKEPPVSGTKSS